MTPLRDHPCPFQPRKSYNILTADNETHLQGPHGGEGPRLHHLWPPSAGAVKGKDPLLHQHRPTTDTQGSLLLHLGTSQPQELFCSCPARLKTSWHPGQNISNSNNFLLDMCPRPHRRCCCRGQQNKFIFFCIQTILSNSNSSITLFSKHSKTLLSKHQFANLHRQIFTQQSKTAGFPLHRVTVKHYNKPP